jgi:hypothetical protein
MMVNSERNTVLKRYGIATLCDSGGRTSTSASVMPMSNPCQTNRDGRGGTDRFILEVMFGDGAPGGIHSNQITSARTGAPDSITRRSRVQIPPPLRKKPLLHGFLRVWGWSARPSIPGHVKPDDLGADEASCPCRTRVLLFWGSQLAAQLCACRTMTR